MPAHSAGNSSGISTAHSLVCPPKAARSCTSRCTWVPWNESEVPCWQRVMKCLDSTGSSSSKTSMTSLPASKSCGEQRVLL